MILLIKTLRSLPKSSTKREAFSGTLFIGLDYATRVSVPKKIALMQPREPQDTSYPQILSLTEQHQSSLTSLVMRRTLDTRTRSLPVELERCRKLCSASVSVCLFHLPSPGLSWSSDLLTP
jgi:hypothetical protein